MGVRRMKRKKPSDVEGSQRRIYRQKIVHSGAWCRSDDAKTKHYDSFVYRYAREVNFKIADAQGAEAAQTCPHVRSAAERGGAKDNTSAAAVKYQSVFELYVLEHCRSTPYGKWLIKLEKVVGKGKMPTQNHKNNPELFMKPDIPTISAYLDHISGTGTSHGVQGRGNVWTSVDNALSGISTTCNSFGAGRVDRSELADRIAVWQGNYEKNEQKDQAPAFDMVHDLPRIRYAVFNRPGWNDDQRRLLWTQILVDLASLGRASCVTKHCPKQKDVVPAKDARRMDRMGVPDDMDVAWRDWKHRLRRRTAYKLRFSSNRIKGQAYYDPVLWLWMHIAHLVEIGKYKPDDPLWAVESSKYRSDVKAVFLWMADHYDEERYSWLSSHSFRRTGTRWARRCGADIKVIMEVGRWKDYNTLIEYLGEGEEDIELDEEGLDPICKFWVFKTFAVNGSEVSRTFRS